MSRQHRTRYDILEVPSELVLYDMYIAEGFEEEEARKKAKEIHNFLNHAVMAEARFWKRVRENEETSGLNPETDERSIL